MSEVLIPSKHFPYLYMPFEILEENQCHNCVFRKLNINEYDGPMCFEVESKILLENEPVSEVTNFGGDDLVCTKYREGNPTPPQIEGQLELF